MPSRVAACALFKCYQENFEKHKRLKMKNGLKNGI